MASGEVDLLLHELLPGRPDVPDDVAVTCWNYIGAFVTGALDPDFTYPTDCALAWWSLHRSFCLVDPREGQDDSTGLNGVVSLDHPAFECCEELLRQWYESGSDLDGLDFSRPDLVRLTGRFNWFRARYGIVWGQDPTTKDVFLLSAFFRCGVQIPGLPIHEEYSVPSTSQTPECSSEENDGEKEEEFPLDMSSHFMFVGCQDGSPPGNVSYSSYPDNWPEDDGTEQRESSEAEI